jgi:hypothetical protein
MSEKEEQQRAQDQLDPKDLDGKRPRGHVEDDEGPDVEGHVKKAARVGARVGHKPRG